jgi:hypothetical protein
MATAATMKSGKKCRWPLLAQTGFGSCRDAANTDIASCAV